MHEDLVGRKSTLQNEILADLQMDIGPAPETGEGLPLEELVIRCANMLQPDIAHGWRKNV